MLTYDIPPELEQQIAPVMAAAEEYASKWGPGIAQMQQAESDTPGKLTIAPDDAVSAASSAHHALRLAMALAVAEARLKMLDNVIAHGGADNAQQTHFNALDAWAEWDIVVAALRTQRSPRRGSGHGMRWMRPTRRGGTFQKRNATPTDTHGRNVYSERKPPSTHTWRWNGRARWRMRHSPVRATRSWFLT